MWFLSELEIQHKDIIDQMNNYIRDNEVCIMPFFGSDSKYLGLGISDEDYVEMMEAKNENK